MTTINTLTPSQKALEKYLGILESMGANEANLNRRRAFLGALLKELDKLPHTEKVYGAVVDERLKSFSQEETRHFFQTTARDFYYFWMQDDAKIKELIDKEELSVVPFRITVPGPLDEVQVTARAYFEAKPSVAVGAYHSMLEEKAESNIDTRLDWVKLVLYIMAEFDPTPDNFRAATEAISLKFESNVQRQSFFVVIREFYPFWMPTV